MKGRIRNTTMTTPKTLALLGRILFPSADRRKAYTRYENQIISAEDWRDSLLANAHYERGNAIREAHRDYHEARRAALTEYDAEVHAALTERDAAARIIAG